MGHAQRAVPARFDPAVKHRNSMIGKIKVAVKQIGMIDDDYRQLLLTETGKLSSSQCSEAQLVKVIDALKAKGFRPLPSRKGAAPAAQHPMARKARALWVSLYHLGAVHNPGEPALEAFAKRQLGCERLVWAKQGEAYRLIEALKAMATRHGWAQVDRCGGPLGPLQFQETLCHAIVARLKEAGAIPADWYLDIAAKRLSGIDTAEAAPWTAGQYQVLAAALGEHLRPALARNPQAKGDGQ